MSEKLPVPSFRDLSRYGRVSPVLMYLGLLLFTLGAFGEISFANRKLMLGAVLVCFSFVWHYVTNLVDHNYFDGQRTQYFVNWGSALGFLVFTASFVVLLVGLLKGHFPFPVSK